MAEPYNTNAQAVVGTCIPEIYIDDENFNPIIIEDFANVATNAIVMTGATISEGSVIGAGTIVTKTTKP